MDSLISDKLMKLEDIIIKGNSDNFEQFKILLKDVDLQELKNHKSNHHSNKIYSLLDLGFLYSKIEEVKALLNKGMDITDSLSHNHQNGKNGSILHHCLKFSKTYDPEIFKDKEVQKVIKSIINAEDSFGYTALHLAARKRCQKTVRYFLEVGANFGTKNDQGESCISQLDPATLEEFLNEYCINGDWKNKDDQKDINHKDFEITFDYK